MQHKHKIIMLAHFGNFVNKAVDGGQTSARRSLNTLKKMGYQVEVVNRRSKKMKSHLASKLYALLWGIWALVLYTLKLIFADRKDTMTLCIGYCGSMMPFDSLAARIAKGLGYKHVFYIKGGRAKPQYVNGSASYKQAFDKAVKASSLIITEGEEMVALCNDICDTPAMHFPNYTEDGFATETLPEKPTGRWNLIYFGRICPEKNVLMTIEAYNQLCEKLDNVHLTLIGKGPTEYMAKVNEAVAASKSRDRITVMPVTGHDKLKNILAEQHFFIFPSDEPNEGHSNSMNEAMSWGVVPIVSDNNFLPDIVGCKELVISSPYDANIFSEKILEIIRRNEFDKYSDYVFERVKNTFTEKVVVGKLERAIKDI